MTMLFLNYFSNQFQYLALQIRLEILQRFAFRFVTLFHATQDLSHFSCIQVVKILGSQKGVFHNFRNKASDLSLNWIFDLIFFTCCLFFPHLGMLNYHFFAIFLNNPPTNLWASIHWQTIRVFIILKLVKTVLKLPKIHLFFLWKTLLPEFEIGSTFLKSQRRVNLKIPGFGVLHNLSHLLPLWPQKQIVFEDDYFPSFKPYWQIFSDEGATQLP